MYTDSDHGIGGRPFLSIRYRLWWKAPDKGVKVFHDFIGFRNTGIPRRFLAAMAHPKHEHVSCVRRKTYIEYARQRRVWNLTLETYPTKHDGKLLHRT